MRSFNFALAIRSKSKLNLFNTKIRWSGNFFIHIRLSALTFLLHYSQLYALSPSNKSPWTKVYKHSSKFFLFATGKDTAKNGSSLSE